MPSSEKLSPVLIFILLLLIGAAIVTSTFRRLQNEGGKTDAGLHLVTDLNAAQKALIQSRQELAKWLIALAYASLAGWFGAVIKNPDDPRFRGLLSLSGAAALTISLYAGFLMHEAVAFVLREGPIDLFYTAYFQFPILAQFIFLVLGLVFLGWPLLLRRHAAAAATLLAVLMLPAAVRAHEEGEPRAADPPETAPWVLCIERWSSDRGVELPAEAKMPAANLALELAQKSDLYLGEEDRCLLAYSLLDDVRFQAHSRDYGRRVSSIMSGILSELLEEARNPDFSPGELLSGLFDRAKIWRADSGVIQVHADRGLTIHLEEELVGRTNWVRRMKPGLYRLRLSWAGKALDGLAFKLELRDRDLLKIEVIGPSAKVTRNGVPL